MIRAAFILAPMLAIAACQKQQPASESSSTANVEVSNAAATPSQDPLAETKLHIEGMVCQGCAEAAKSCLGGIDGVVEANVSIDDRIARVRYDASKTSPPDMIAALEAVDRGEAPAFHATVSGPGE